MKLNCPYCGETIPYEASLAGQSVGCPYCEKVLKMPPFEELPQEVQDELRQKAAKIDKKQKRRYLRKQKAFLKDLEKEEERKQKQEALQTQQQSQAKIDASAAGSRSTERPLGLVLTAIYSALAAWLYFQAYCTSTSLGGAMDATGDLLKEIGSKAADLLGDSSGLLESFGGDAAGPGVVPTVLLALVTLLSLAAALLLAAICYGLLTLQKWSYRLTFIAYAMAGVTGLLAILADSSRQNVVRQLPNIVAALLVIMYFRQPRIQALFGR